MPPAKSAVDEPPQVVVIVRAIEPPAEFGAVVWG